MLQNIAAVPMQDPLYALRIPSRVLSFKLFEWKDPHEENTILHVISYGTDKVKSRYVTEFYHFDT